MKTTNIHKTKNNETKAWFRSLFMSSGQEILQLPGPTVEPPRLQAFTALFINIVNLCSTHMLMNDPLIL